MITFVLPPNRQLAHHKLRIHRSQIISEHIHIPKGQGRRHIADTLKNRAGKIRVIDNKFYTICIKHTADSKKDNIREQHFIGLTSQRSGCKKWQNTCDNINSTSAKSREKKQKDVNANTNNTKIKLIRT